VPKIAIESQEFRLLDLENGSVVGAAAKEYILVLVDQQIAQEDRVGLRVANDKAGKDPIEAESADNDDDGNRYDRRRHQQAQQAVGIVTGLGLESYVKSHDDVLAFAA
jgi:hypothetical protein